MRATFAVIMVASPRRRFAPVLALIAVLFVATVARPARAEGRTEFLVQRLRADDFRVRTNAALALGATNDDAALVPLCAALDDGSEVVRQASAVALKRLLKPTSLECLKRHLDTEKNDSVKLQISRAVEAIEASAGAGGGDSVLDAPPKLVAKARYYVALSPVTNNTGRPQVELDRVVFASVRAKLDELGSYQIAPAKESVEAARGVMQKRKLKGFYLMLSIDKLDYSAGNLKVTARLVVFTYPGKAMQGMINRTLSQSGVRPGDRSAEDNLISMAAAAVIDGFAQNVGNL